MRTDRVQRYARVLLLVAALVTVPLWADDFWLRFLTAALMLAVLGQSWQVMLGLTGYPALGNVVFFGVGAYSGGVLSAHYGLTPSLIILCGAACAAVASAAVSRGLLSLRGSHFLMGTVALNALVAQVVLALGDVTRGSQGLVLPIWFDGAPDRFGTYYYLIFLALLAISSVAIVLIRRSRLGLGLAAIKGNEDTAQSLGIPTYRYKTVAWSVSAALAGATGAVYAHWIGFIQPDDVFDLILSIEVFLMVLIGGRMLIVGPLLGALLWEYTDHIAVQNLGQANLALLGAVIVVVVLFVPGGIPDIASRARTYLGRAKADAGV